MNRNEFIEKLTKKLSENKIGDMEEIVSEYEEHFTYKLADGYSEEEIAAKLGDPEGLALQFVAENKEHKSGALKAFVVTGLVFSHIFAGMFFVLLYAWTAVMAVFSAASAATGACILTGFNPYSLLPPMPYFCGAVFAVSLIALSALSAVGCLYFTSFVRQLMRAYGRYSHNQIASASGKAALPPLAAYPKLPAKKNRNLRRIALFSLTVFAVCAVSGYVLSAVSAGALGFWHAWHWFVR